MRIRINLLFLPFMLIASTVLAQETVYIQSIEKGRGILKSRAGECFVICPLHVISEDDDEIIIKGISGIQSRVQFNKGFPSDLAALKVSSEGRLNCTSWNIHTDYSYILDSAYKGFLELRNSNGMTTLVQVYIKGKSDSYIKIKPVHEEESLMKGFSGSSLFTEFNGEKVYLGMLQKIKKGIGYVLQADNIERLTYEFYNPSIDAEPTTINEEKSYLKKQLLHAKFNADLTFLEEYFEELQNNSNRYLVSEFKKFLDSRASAYIPLNDNELMNAGKRGSYNSSMNEIQIIIKDCEKILNYNVSEWDTKAVPLISTFAIYLEDLLDLLI